ncbi:MAG: pyridoxal-phosphate dependent enzyme [Burkholderiaceae bacterium]
MTDRVLHVATPTIASLPLSTAAGRAIDLKLENLQPSGSFKMRGIGAACVEYARRGARRLLSSSGGNAGIAVACVGRMLGIPVVVVVPETTTARARRLIEEQGATLIVHGASWQEANERAQSMAGTTDAFVHPFDDPLVWAGHATMIDEAARTGVKPDAVVVAVGGGGLLCGVIEGLHRNGWSDVPLVAVETEGAASLRASMDAGRCVTLDAITSIATSLGAKRVCERAFGWTREHPVASVLVTDAAAVDACLRFIDDHRIVVEPACGAALATVYGRVADLERFERVLVIVCGGATATVDQLQAWATSTR